MSAKHEKERTQLLHQYEQYRRHYIHACKEARRLRMTCDPGVSYVSNRGGTLHLSRWSSYSPTKYLLTYLLTSLLTYLLTHLLTYLLTRLLTSLLTYLLTYLLA